MNRTAQFKYWVFGFGLAVAVYLVINGVWGNSLVALGLALAVAMIGAFSLGAVWDVARDAETAATWQKKERDEQAKQSYLKVVAGGSKMIGAPSPQGQLTDEQRAAMNRDDRGDHQEG